MTVDQEIQEAGARLAAARVAVPEVGALVRCHRRRRALTAGGGPVVLLVLAVVAGLRGDAADRGPVDTETADADSPAVGAPIGLADEGIWPAPDRRFATPGELAAAFAAEVLRWDDAGVAVDPAEPNSPTGLTVTHDPGRSVRMLVVPIRGRWTLLQLGAGGGLTMRASGDDTLVTVSSGPPGTASIRWWVRLAGDETASAEPAGTGTFAIPVPIEHVGTLLVVHYDEDGVALSAAASAGDIPTMPVTLPSTPKSAFS